MADWECDTVLTIDLLQDGILSLGSYLFFKIKFLLFLDFLFATKNNLLLSTVFADLQFASDT